MNGQHCILTIVLVMILLKTIDACHKCECDSHGALSSCQTNKCTPNHVQVTNPSKCDKRGQICCRMMCSGEGSMCMPDSKPCMKGHTLVLKGSCKQGYKCCLLKTESMLRKITSKSIKKQ